MKVELPAHARSVAAARRATADFLRDQGAPSGISADDAVLAVSELVTNAVQAGAGRILLELTLRDGVLTLLVEDDAPGRPAAQPFTDDSERGRGLGIVARVADHWGVHPTRRGKAVVARFSQSVST